MRATGVLSLTYYVHVNGDNGMVPTPKLGQVDPIIAWEVYFTLCVNGCG